MSGGLGIDVGGTGTRWRLSGSGRCGDAEGFSGHLFRPEMAERARIAIAAIAAAAGPADTVVAGVTGLTSSSAEAALMEAIIGRAFGAQAVAVMSDMELAYRAAFEPGGGILVYAGTGSIAAHLKTDGSLVTVGGKGVVIDDAGGGHWIAVQALRSILRREDARPGSAWETALGRALSARLGGIDWSTVKQAVYGGDRGSVGRLALAAGEACAAGDDAAIAILRAAGAELAEVAVTLEGRLARPGRARLPVALAGRAAGLHQTIFESFAAALPGRASAIVALDAAEHAARLAARPEFFDSRKKTPSD